MKPQPSNGIRTALVEVPESKELRVHVRGDQHAMLASLKALGKGNLSTLVEDALDVYFEHLRTTRESEAA